MKMLNYFKIIRGKKERKKIKNWALFLFFCSIFYCFGQKSMIFGDFFQKNTTIRAEGANPSSFQHGENLKYKISYGKKNKRNGMLLAGHATCNVKDSLVNNSSVHILSARGKTTKLFSLFMRVEHYYKSIVKKETLKTIESVINAKQANQHHFERVDSTDIMLQNGQNDLLGAAYRLRNTPVEKISNLDTLFFSYYYNGRVYQSYLINFGEEVVKTKFGKIKTIKYSPRLEKGNIFKSETGAFVWVTDDEMRIPIKIELPVLVGSIYASLVSYENTLFNIKN